MRPPKIVRTLLEDPDTTQFYSRGIRVPEAGMIVRNIRASGMCGSLRSLYIEAKILEYLTLKLTLRAYYETEPADADPDAEGDDVISVRQETLLGATYTF